MLIEGIRRAEESLEKIIQTSMIYGKNTHDFFETVALQTDPDTFDYKTEKVALMTMHSAKGLEFPIVFITGCEEGYIPFMRQENKTFDIDEERRLFYVAMTRAMDKLYISSAKKRRIYGNRVPRKPSPFIKDIEDTLKNYEKKKSKKSHTNQQIQLTLF